MGKAFLVSFLIHISVLAVLFFATSGGGGRALEDDIQLRCAGMIEVDSPTFENVFRNVQKASGDNQLAFLETLLNRAQFIPEQNIREINQKVRQDYQLADRVYRPVREVEIGALDVHSIVPFYRTIDRDGHRFFQELWVDKAGNFMVGKEKPLAQTTLQEQILLKAFELTGRNAVFEQLRDTAIGLAEQKSRK